MQFVAAFFESEDFEGFVGRIANPILLRAETGLEVFLFVTVPAHAGGRDQFDQQIGSSENGAALNDTRVSRSDENDVGLDGVLGVENHINGSEERLAHSLRSEVPVNDAE